jgi:hypothetical protein
MYKIKKMTKKLIFLVFVILAVCPLKAQNFSGHYVIESKRMINGVEYLNAIAKDLIVTQNRDSLKITRLIPSEDGETTTATESLALNGKSIVSMTLSNRKKTATLSFDKVSRTATIVYVLSYMGKPEEIEFRNTEVWALNGDGTLTITKTSDATNTDDWTIKAVFKTK